MINKLNNPEAWDSLIDEFEDACDHLGTLVEALNNEPNYSEEELRIDLGHIMAHLNRAWRRRAIARALTDEEWADFRQYPIDLEPLA